MALSSFILRSYSLDPIPPSQNSYGSVGEGEQGGKYPGA